MDPNRGKPVATSVPSITIKFHANAEQLEELFTMSDEESTTTTTTTDVTTTITTTTTTISNESDKSPLKLFPRFVKRSTSIDITPVTKQQTDNSSPPSDPWRFFSDIKGKITKSVEDKITEIKSRNCDENSPSKQLKDTSSSLSDSEEISESSISKTCGAVSTTEGVEMSTDDDDNHDDNDTNNDEKSKKKLKNLRQRFKLLKSSMKSNKTNNQQVTISTLSKLYDINADRIEQALEDNNHNIDVDDVEDAIEAIEDDYDHRIITTINDSYDNITITDDDVIKIHAVRGKDLKKLEKTTVFAPTGHVDMRTSSTQTITTNKRLKINLIKIIAFFIFYIIFYYYSTYWSGVLFGIITTHLFLTIKSLLYPDRIETLQQHQQQQQAQVLKNIIEIEAVKEFHPLKKYEGWVNELPETYNPHTYHINQTQSAYLRLQGNLLRVSHTRVKIPKRALWNEAKIKPIFTHHRIYNLLNAKIQLLPKGLAKKRNWSKKYPICIVLSNAVEQFKIEAPPVPPPPPPPQQQSQEDSESYMLKCNKRRFLFNQQFSKLAADDDNLENSRGNTPPSTSSDINEELKNDLEHDEDDDDNVDVDPLESWPIIEESHHRTKLYIFGRTDREKEEWFRRLKLAATLHHTNNQTDYLKFMQYFDKNLQTDHDFDKIKDDSIKDNTTTNKLLEEYCLNNILWVNTLLGRVLYDLLYNNMNFTQKIKERIQRKLATIKLPYFIEEISISELSLGHTPPVIHSAEKPVIDERGLWIDLDITYEGLVVLILHTKLNLMKLKQPPTEKAIIDEKLAIFNSDLDDSAESSSDDNLSTMTEHQQLLENTNNISTNTASNSKKFMRMVDKIAESKIFQAASENRLIKRAMENVSNTDLSLRCELKQLNGTLVLNIPSPPSDRLWIGFKPLPTISMKAQPIVGETNITFMRITGWIERKLLQEFQKVLVLPNMEDLTIPEMTPRVVH